MKSTLKKIQTKVGAEPDGEFGPQTAFRIGKFLRLNIVEASHFIGQAYEETGGFTQFVENPNYSADFLHKNFRAFKDRAVAEEYAHQPVRIANRAYANRGGNGDEASGTGWMFRGRGIFQTTLFQNYLRASRRLADPQIMVRPGLIVEKYALESARIYWEDHTISSLCKDLSVLSITRVTRAINGPGLVHLQERINYTLKVHAWLSNLNY